MILQHGLYGIWSMIAMKGTVHVVIEKKKNEENRERNEFA